MMNASIRIFAIVPAAGLSRRMGRPKQLIDVGGRPMLLRLVEAIATVDEIAGVMVVTRRTMADALGWSRLDAGVGKLRVAFNEDESSEMIDSIRIGLRAWYEREKIAPRDGILICPGDYPALTTDAFRACAASYCAADEDNPSAMPILVASHQGRRGHPIIFPTKFIPFVESLACDAGLNALTRMHADRVKLVDLPTDAVLRDADEPDDLPESQ